MGQRYRWENAGVPYVVEPDVPDATTRVQSAMKAWSDATQVRFIPRTTETDYVQFRRRNGFVCSSNVGRTGGQQFISLPDDCGTTTIIHELGHALGLWHTQSRQDRGLFVDVDFASIDRVSASNYRYSVLDGEDYGAYPYDSIMHYGLGGFALPNTFAMQTNPRGIATGQRDALSPSDVDAMVRLYGQTPVQTTVTSNPPDVPIRVDGQVVMTPVRFTWAPGSTHILNAEDQLQGVTLLSFGR